MIELIYKGYSVLTIAIILNISSTHLNIETWYSFISKAKRMGFFNALKKSRLVDLLFLFVVYPIALGYATILPEVLING